MAEFPVAFIFIFDDFEASQAIQYCHDKAYEIYDFFYHGFNVIGFETFHDFEFCRQWCIEQNMRMIAYQISYMSMPI
jgi:hypothetical protein